MSNKKYLCIYHGNCADGFTSAWVLRNALGEENVDFVAGIYGKDLMVDPPPRPLMEYDCIYLVDFSYKRPALLAMASLSKRIVIIDHHKTAQEDLVDLPSNVECHFDMEHSGAMLTWMYFQRLQWNDSSEAKEIKSTDAPALIQRVEDRDLWKFKFSDTRDVAAKIFSHEYTFENWDMMAELYKDSPMSVAESVMKNVFLAEGAAIERKHFKDIKELLTVSGYDRARILGHSVPIANLPYTMSSDAATMLAEGEKFGVCYMFDAAGIKFSFRSSDKGMDVGKIAFALGGGGHRNSSGVNMSHTELARRALVGEILMHYKGGKE